MTSWISLIWQSLQMVIKPSAASSTSVMVRWVAVSTKWRAVSEPEKSKQPSRTMGFGVRIVVVHRWVVMHPSSKASKRRGSGVIVGKGEA